MDRTGRHALWRATFPGLTAFEQAAQKGENNAGNWFLRAIILTSTTSSNRRKSYERFWP
jgi:hypothetical protein